MVDKHLLRFLHEQLLIQLGYIFSEHDTAGLLFEGSSPDIRYYDGSTSHTTSPALRDTSAWYHVVMSAASGTNNIILYVNGTNVFAGDEGTGSMTVNTNIIHTIGKRSSGSSSYFNGYMANIHFIDGHALNPNYFAKTDTATGAWIPKEFDGTSSTGGANANGANPSNAAGYDTLYGINGFHLDFRASSLVYSGSTLSTVNDVSGRTTPNNWTAN